MIDCIHDEEPSGTEPQLKSEPSFHHEGREEHEVKKFKSINFPILRGLHPLRTTMLENLRGLGKFQDTKHLGFGHFSRQGAKNAKFG